MCSCPVFIAIVFFFDYRVVNWSRLLILGPVGRTALHRSVHGFVSLLFKGNTAMPGELHARLCHAFLVFSMQYIVVQG